MDLSEFDFSCFDCDHCGNLYAVASASSLAPESSDAPSAASASAQIAVVDIRQKVMSSKQSKAGDQLKVPLTSAKVKHIIQTTPKIGFKVRNVVVSRNGHYLACCGSESADSADYSVLTVVDLHGAKPVMRPRPVGDAPQPLSSSTALHIIDQQLFGSRPGLKILQMSWHPHSENHLAVLTSDRRWRLYSVYNPSQAEQTFHLCAHTLVASTGGGRASASAGPGTPWEPMTPGGMSPGGRMAPRNSTQFGLRSASDVGTQIVAFDFGPPVSWGMFNVNFVSASGTVFALCPVTPFGMRVPASVLRHIQMSEEEVDYSSSSAPASVFLEVTFGPSILDGIHSRSHWTVKPHIHEAASPVLQSLLDPRSEAAVCNARGASASLSKAVGICAAHHLEFQGQSRGGSDLLQMLGSGTPLGNGDDGCERSASTSPPVVTSAVVTAFSDGQILVHLMQDLVTPRWSLSSPQCVTDSQGHIKATRTECEAASLTPAVAGASEDASCGEGRLVLMDVVELPLLLPDAPDPVSDDEDGDDNSTAGDNASCLSSLEKLKMIGSDESPQQLWACHSSGCWNVNISWLPLVAKALSKARNEANTPAGLQAYSTTMLGTLPAPAVHELMCVAANSGPHLSRQQQKQQPMHPSTLLWACPLHDVFVGSLAVVRQGTNLLCLSTRGHVGPLVAATPAGILTPDGAGAAGKKASEAPGTASLRSTAGRAAASSSPSSESRLAAIESNIQALYGDLLQEPQPLSLPKPEGPVGAKSPEGVAYLHDCINLIRQAHIKRIHRAHHDLSERCKQLDSEGAAHVAGVEEMKALADRLADRQAGLLGRLSQVTQLQRNLMDRAELLTSLHWSMPRPVSDAEQEFSVQLAQLSDNQSALQSTWEGLQARANSLKDGWKAAERKAAGGVGAQPQSPALPSPMVCEIPKAQMARVQASVIEQFRLISMCKADVAQAEESIKRWKRDLVGVVTANSPTP